MAIYYSCSICEGDTNYLAPRFLWQHLYDTHGLDLPRRGPGQNTERVPRNVKKHGCASCPRAFPSVAAFNNHLIDDHQADIPRMQDAGDNGHVDADNDSSGSIYTTEESQSDEMLLTDHVVADRLSSASQAVLTPPWAPALSTATDWFDIVSMRLLRFILRLILPRAPQLPAHQQQDEPLAMSREMRRIRFALWVMLTLLVAIIGMLCNLTMHLKSY
ncbi:hypothetical protein BC940DRAFT_357632 [Gongronella butleri]|nr:hypothetical protein BC940DRAFT_357632 [Gongronella butleri]